LKTKIAISIALISLPVLFSACSLGILSRRNNPAPGGTLKEVEGFQAKLISPFETKKWNVPDVEASDLIPKDTQIVFIYRSLKDAQEARARFSSPITSLTFDESVSEGEFFDSVPAKVGLVEGLPWSKVIEYVNKRAEILGAVPVTFFKISETSVGSPADYEALKKDYLKAIGHQPTLKGFAKPSDQEIKIAFIDTGVNPAEGALAKRVVFGVGSNYVLGEDPDRPIESTSDHGTAVMSVTDLLLGDLLPKVKYYPIRLSFNQRGLKSVSNQELFLAIRRAVNYKVSIINMSVVEARINEKGETEPITSIDAALGYAIYLAVQRNVFISAAAGNALYLDKNQGLVTGAIDPITYEGPLSINQVNGNQSFTINPGSWTTYFPGVMGGAAVLTKSFFNNGLELSIFSNWGKNSVEIAAPGTEVPVVGKSWNGTSFVAPAVTAGAALVLARLKEKNLDTHPAFIESILLNGTPTLSPLEKAERGIIAGRSLNLKSLAEYLDAYVSLSEAERMEEPFSANFSAGTGWNPSAEADWMRKGNLIMTVTPPEPSVGDKINVKAKLFFPGREPLDVSRDIIVTSNRELNGVRCVTFAEDTRQGLNGQIDPFCGSSELNLIGHYRTIVNEMKVPLKSKDQETLTELKIEPPSEIVPLSVNSFELIAKFETSNGPKTKTVTVLGDWKVASGPGASIVSPGRLSLLDTVFGKTYTLTASYGDKTAEFEVAVPNLLNPKLRIQTLIGTTLTKGQTEKLNAMFTLPSGREIEVGAAWQNATYGTIPNGPQISVDTMKLPFGIHDFEAKFTIHTISGDKPTSAKVSLNVVENLDHITFVTVTPVIKAGEIAQTIATAYPVGNASYVLGVANGVTYRSSAAPNVTIDSQGVIRTAQSFNGTSTITATYFGKSANFILTVIPFDANTGNSNDFTLRVEPDYATAPFNWSYGALGGIGYRAMADYTDGSKRDVSNQASFSAKGDFFKDAQRSGDRYFNYNSSTKACDQAGKIAVVYAGKTAERDVLYLKRGPVKRAFLSIRARNENVEPDANGSIGKRYIGDSIDNLFLVEVSDGRQPNPVNAYETKWTLTSVDTGKTYTWADRGNSTAALPAGNYKAKVTGNYRGNCLDEVLTKEYTFELGEAPFVALEIVTLSQTDLQYHWSKPTISFQVGLLRASGKRSGKIDNKNLVFTVRNERGEIAPNAGVVSVTGGDEDFLPSYHLVTWGPEIKRKLSITAALSSPNFVSNTISRTTAGMRRYEPRDLPARAQIPAQLPERPAADPRCLNADGSPKVFADTVIAAGTGKSDDPFLICTEGQLFNHVAAVLPGLKAQNLVRDLYFVAGRNLDYQGIANFQKRIPLFQRILLTNLLGRIYYDFKGYRISNVKFIDQERDGLSLFERVDDLTIRNLIVDRVVISGRFNVAAIATSAESLVLENVIVANSTLTGSTIGGLLASSRGATLKNCGNFHANIYSVFGTAGGLIGNAELGNKILESWVDADLTFQLQANGLNFGGIVGAGGAVPALPPASTDVDPSFDVTKDRYFNVIRGSRYRGSIKVGYVTSDSTGTGGIIGYGGAAILLNNESSGTISAGGSNVGGISGNQVGNSPHNFLGMVIRNHSDMFVLGGRDSNSFSATAGTVGRATGIQIHENTTGSLQVKAPKGVGGFLGHSNDSWLAAYDNQPKAEVSTPDQIGCGGAVGLLKPLLLTFLDAARTKYTPTPLFEGNRWSNSATLCRSSVAEYIDGRTNVEVSGIER